MITWIAENCISLFDDANALFASVDWKNILAGFLVAGFPFLIKTIIIKYQLYKSGHYKIFNGDFWLYHPSGTKINVIHEKNIRFSLNIFGSISAELFPLESNSVSLVGRVLYSASSVIYVLFYTKDRKEIALLTLNKPIAPTFSITTGIISGVSVEYIPMSAFVLVSRERLSMEEVRRRVPKSSRLISKKVSG